MAQPVDPVSTSAPTRLPVWTESPAWVPDTRFGLWFQRTRVWRRWVLEPAFEELVELMDPGARPGRILDVGCGDGVALPALRERFQPESLVGLEIDPALLRRAAGRARAAGATLLQGDASRLDLPDASFDLLLCHQTLHHVSDPTAVVREMHRVLARGGCLLLSESCRRFIDKAWVRLFFRHPMEARQSPEGYLALLRSAGFQVDPQRVRHPQPVWAGGSRITREPPGAEPLQLLVAATR